MTTRALLVLALALCALPAAAQDVASHFQYATRPQLQASVAAWDSIGADPAIPGEEREHARGEAERMRQRLARGDFNVGDQVALVVEGEPAMTATFSVTTGRVIQLPGVGDVPLGGVLRSELTPHLATHLGRFIRQPVVRARSLVRVAVTGQVRTPGYYVLPADAPLTDALMAAGGPLSTGHLERVRVDRDSERLWAGRPLRRALAGGRTLDQMGLVGGDEVVVPAGRAGASSVMRYLTTVPAAVAAMVGIVRLM
jgi:protein involved in polysaccharide export with SLBB domain